MTKIEVVQAVAYAHVPEGATLAMHDLPGGLTVSGFVAGGDMSGLLVMQAGFLAEQLTEDVASLPEEPSAVLFVRLHEAIVSWTHSSVRLTAFEAVGDEMVEQHRKAIAKLREIAAKLGIDYVAPADRFLQ